MRVEDPLSLYVILQDCEVLVVHHGLCAGQVVFEDRPLEQRLFPVVLKQVDGPVDDHELVFDQARGGDHQILLVRTRKVLLQHASQVVEEGVRDAMCGQFHLLSGSLYVLPILEGLLVREQLAHVIDGLLGVGTQGHSEVQGVVLINAITHNKAVVLKQVRVVSLPVVVVDLLPGFDIPAGAVHHDEVRVGVRVAPPPELVYLPQACVR